MTVTITYKQTPPRRPNAADFHGGALIDDTECPPDPGDPHADAMNQSDLQLPSISLMTQAVGLWVKITAGTPAIFAIISLRDDLVAGDFTLVDNAAGDTSITHTGGKLWAMVVPGWAGVVSDTEIDRIRAIPITNGVRVKTKLGAVATDCDFVVYLHGI